MSYKKITTLDELKQACTNNSAEFIIQLNWGLRSSMSISYNPDTDNFTIFNYIDDTEQELSSEQIMNEEYTNIGKAITYGSFFQEKTN